MCKGGVGEGGGVGVFICVKKVGFHLYNLSHNPIRTQGRRKLEKKSYVGKTFDSWTQFSISKSELEV
jgi:hypothetical protein